MRVRLRALVAVPLALVAAASAQPPVTVRLQHRSAESLLTVLRPLAAPAALTGSGMQLQVSAPPAEVARVVRLVERSDRPLQPLAVALREEPPPPAGSEAPARSGSIELSTGRPMAADPRANAQVLSTGQPMAADPNENARVLSTQPGTAAAPLFEGDPFRISLPASQSLWVGVHPGPAAPKPQAGASAGRRAPGAGPEVAGAVRFDAMADFVARIWLAGETVAIDLRPLAAGRVDAAPDPGPGPEAGTVYGKLGQWIALADSGAALQGLGAAPSAGPRTGLWIRVDAARPGAGPP